MLFNCVCALVHVCLCVSVRGCTGVVCVILLNIYHIKIQNQVKICFLKTFCRIASSYINNPYQTIIITKTYEMLLSNMSEEQRISRARVRIGCDFVERVALFRALLLAGHNV